MGSALEQAFEAATGLWPPAPPTGDGRWAVGCGFVPAVPARPGARSPASSWLTSPGTMQLWGRDQRASFHSSPGEQGGSGTVSAPDGCCWAVRGQGTGAVGSRHSGPGAWLAQCGLRTDQLPEAVDTVQGCVRPRHPLQNLTGLGRGPSSLMRMPTCGGPTAAHRLTLGHRGLGGREGAPRMWESWTSIQCPWATELAPSCSLGCPPKAGGPWSETRSPERPGRAEMASDPAEGPESRCQTGPTSCPCRAGTRTLAGTGAAPAGLYSSPHPSLAPAPHPPTSGLKPGSLNTSPSVNPTMVRGATQQPCSHLPSPGPVPTVLGPPVLALAPAPPPVPVGEDWAPIDRAALPGSPKGSGGRTPTGGQEEWHAGLTQTGEVFVYFKGPLCG